MNSPMVAARRRAAWATSLGRGGHTDLPETFPGADEAAEEVLGELHALGVEIDAAKAEADQAREDAKVYPAERQAELVAAVRSGDAAPADRGDEIRTRLHVASERAEALRTASLQVALEGLPILEASAPAIGERARSDAGQAARKARPQVVKALDNLRPVSEALVRQRWAANPRTRLPQPGASEVEAILTDALAAIDRLIADGEG